MMLLLPLLPTIGSGTILLFAASRDGSEKDAAKLRLVKRLARVVIALGVAGSLPLLGSTTFAA
jgi:hypothetical protein